MDCVHCDKTFSTSSNLLRHHRKVHKLETATAKKVCQCDLCGRRFSSVPCLRRHQRSKHAIINLIKCDKCKSGFRSTAKYEAHLQSCHLVEAVKSEVDTTHLTSTSTETKVSSSLKEKSIDGKGILVSCKVKDTGKEKSPVSTKHSRNAIACKKCLLTFKRRAYLFAHAIKCKGDKSFKTCPVSDECHFRYRLSSTLQTHLKSIHDCDSLPEMQCKTCLLTFTRQSTLNDHVKTCKGPPSQKLLTCPTSAACKFRARFKRTLTLHLKNVHHYDILPPREMKFDNWNEFMTWKRNEEESSGSCFTSQSGMKNGKSFFYCQRDGTAKPHTSMPRKTRRTLKKGRVKTGAFCTAYIRFNINSDGTVLVKYVSTHSHAVDIGNKVISSSRRNNQRGDITEVICGSELECERIVSALKSETDAEETVPESMVIEASEDTINSNKSAEVSKTNPSFGFKVHEDEMVTVLYLTSESQELPEGIFDYVNSTTSDNINDSAVIEINSTDSELFTIDDSNLTEPTVAAVIDINNAQPVFSEVYSISNQITWKEKIKSTMEDILSLLENDPVKESVLSSVFKSLQECRNQIEVDINQENNPFGAK